MLHEQLPPDALPLALIQVHFILSKETDLLGARQIKRPLPSDSSNAILQNVDLTAFNISLIANPFIWLVKKRCSNPTRCAIIQLPILLNPLIKDRRNLANRLCKQYNLNVLWITNSLHSVLQCGYGIHYTDFRT